MINGTKSNNKSSVRKPIALVVALIASSSVVSVTLSGASTSGSSSYDASANAACQPLQVYGASGPLASPLTASDSELKAAGYPPRPVENVSALAGWEHAMNSVKNFTTPQPVCGSTTHALVNSNIWAGHVVNNSDFGGVHFTSSESIWTQPSVSGNSGYSNYLFAPAASFWTGIGVSSLIQAGADSIATGTPQYRFWTEDYPADTIWEGPVIRPGNQAYVYVEYIGSYQANYFLENVTTGEAQAFTNAATYVGYNAANFINERMGSYYLPNFGSTTMSSNGFGSSSTNWSLTSTNDKVTMIASCGTVMSQPAGVSTDSHFALNWYSSSPTC